MIKIKRCGIYSFPKSGNTWMREIVRGIFKSNEDIKKVVPDIYTDNISGEILAAPTGEKWQFYKSHGSRELDNYKGIKVFNDLIIYIMRNPLDVFCSQLNYLLRGFDPTRGGIQIPCESIDSAKDCGLIEDYFSAFTIFGTLMPFFLDAKSWMQNITYWINRSENSENIIIIRYEDMIEDFYHTLEPLIFRFGMNSIDLEQAMRVASSRTNDGGKFFWKKKQGTYKEYLTKSQIERFFYLHSNVIKLSGYDKYFYN